MSDSNSKHTNRLIHEHSPYLLQHAHNPVDWYPWGEEALNKAKQEQKPILVSIGYATCHWCHVMERESFEDEAVADYLNEHFVAIKVDREERPDVDKIYMDALHALGQGGGWPLNMLLTPDAVPFSGGTYFPPEARYGRPSFLQSLQRAFNLWSTQRDKVETAAKSIKSFVERGHTVDFHDGGELNDEPHANLLKFAQARYDSIEGGFDTQSSNKFPPSLQLQMLLRMHRSLSNEHIVSMVEHTIEKMKTGGIYDQIGGGLARYATSKDWLRPHFEKMLYDNALWIELLVDTYQSLKKSQYKDWAYDCIDYIRRDLLSPEGAFYSAEDADSEGHEGQFYIWTKDEFDSVVGEHAALVAEFWDVTASGNAEGSNILHETAPRQQFADKNNLSLTELNNIINNAGRKLFAARSKRVRPLLDDKILTSWNALMISAFAKAAQAFEDRELLNEAERAASFIFDNCVDGSGRLLRRYRAGDARYKAYLVDYAQLANACIDLFEANFNIDWLKRARALMEQVDDLFKNPDGAYFDTGSDAEKLMTRTMDGHDGVEPSGNSAAALAFIRLFGYFSEDQFRERTDNILRSFWRQLIRAPWGHPYMMRSLDPLCGEHEQIVCVGDESDPEFRAIRSYLAQEFLPEVQVLALNNDQQQQCQGLPLLQGRSMIDGKVTVFICKNFSCQLPIHTLKELQVQLQ